MKNDNMQHGVARRCHRVSFFLISAFSLLFFSGCRSLHKATATVAPDTTVVPEVVIPEPVPEVQKRELTAMNFTATVDGMSVSGQVRQASDSIIWVTVSKFFELGRAKATVDSVWVSVPLAGRRFAGTYAEASRVAKREVSFEALQGILGAPDAERQIEALAATLGLEATVRLGRRQKMETLTFPFNN